MVPISPTVPGAVNLDRNLFDAAGCRCLNQLQVEANGLEPFMEMVKLLMNHSRSPLTNVRQWCIAGEFNGSLSPTAM